MNPVVKRILIQGGLTAALLALVGVMLAELASIWVIGNAGGKPNSPDLNPNVTERLRYRVPLTLAGLGFLFVAVGELVLQRFRKTPPPAKSGEPPPDEAETLLNELLAQAEAKMAAEKQDTQIAEEGSTVAAVKAPDEKPKQQEDPGPKSDVPPG
jgi:hypothetical protein